MSKIEWTDETWNPIAGCSIVSPGCTNCYAMKMAARLEAMAGDGIDDNGYAVRGTGPLDHYRKLTKRTKAGPVWTGKVALAPEATLTKPLTWRRPRRVFVNSMSDLFHDDVPDAAIDRVFAVMALSPQHTFQVLTKRSARMREYITQHRDIAAAVHEVGRAARLQGEAWRGRWTLPLPNVWLGVSCERQQEADARIPDLLATPAAVRYVSAEPLLGPIDFTRLPLEDGYFDALRAWHWVEGRGKKCSVDGPKETLDWIIVGGESGANARPMHPDWALSIRDQCTAAGVAFFFKQWGEWLPVSDAPEPLLESLYKSNRIAKDGENQANLDDCYGRTCRVKTGVIRYDGRHVTDNSFGGFEVLEGHCGYLNFAVGKARAGRRLDGREWNEYPEGGQQAAGSSAEPAAAAEPSEAAAP